MTRMPFALAALAFVAACEEIPTGVPTGAEVVPFAQVLAETEGRPFECTAFDPTTNTCESVATNQAIEGGFRRDARALISADPRIELRGTAAFQQVDDRVCTSLGSVQWRFVGDGITPFTEELARADLETQAAEIGVICVTYLRAGLGYITQTTDAAGRPVDGFEDDVVTFLSARPGLRVPEFE